jgi:hypothetical protein
MKKIIPALFLLINIQFANCQELNKKYQPIILDFINCVKSQNKEKLSSKIRFPLKREYPIPPIKNKQEFLKRYNEVFDDYLTKKIIGSTLTEWNDVGWRGIMLLNGELWLDYDGKLISVNHQSVLEKKEKERIIKLEKNTLNPSIQAFKAPVLIFETTSYRVRIDDLGSFNYRYSSWPIKSKVSDEPALIIKNGKWTPDGSGGNHNYQFKNGGYNYICYINELDGNNTPTAILVITKAGKEIFSQKSKRIKL